MKTLFKKKQKRRRVFNMVRRKRIVERKKRQRGGVMFCRKPRLMNKIAKGMTTFATLGAKLAGQVLKGVTDEV